jgi:uncharacterized membrane protein
MREPKQRTEQRKGAADHPAQQNVRTISRLERDALQARSLAERVSDGLLPAIGSIPSIVLHVIMFSGWIVVNCGLVPRIDPFDPFPFGVLTLFVSTEAVLLAIMILISQNRVIRQADRRAHLDLQVNLLAEQEATLTLHMLQRISRQVGVPPDARDAEAQKLIEQTDVYKMMRQLESQLPND